MRPDLPWNVAGIPPEAREAARAAARREGLSVGEWLTRRIVSGLAGIEGTSETRSAWVSSASDGDVDRRQDSETRRDSHHMLEKVRASETETADTYRRIEDQLRAVGRRLETTERNQNESSREINRTASEMNETAREQAQAFEQLGQHVVALSDRLERLERHGPSEGLDDAVKALHQGMARLADQIAKTAGQSESQIAAVSGSLESLANRLGQTRQEADSAKATLENSLVGLSKRIQAVESAGQAPDLSDAVAKLSESVGRLEVRGADPATGQAIEKRLSGIERTLGDLIGRIDGEDAPDTLRIEETLARLSRRLDAVEKVQEDAQIALRKDTTAAPVAPPPPAFASAAEPPPFVEPPPVFAPAPTETASGLPPFAGQTDAMPPFTEPEAPASGSVDSYLAAARRSAIAAQAEAERQGGGFSGFSWGGQPPAAPAPKPKRGISIGIAVLALVVVIAALASTFLSHRLPHKEISNAPAAVLDEKKPTPTPVAPPTTDVSADPSDVAPAQVRPPAANETSAKPKLITLYDLKTMASGGNAKAALVLGLKYLSGNGVAADDKAAAHWLQKAAAAGEPMAQYRFAVMVERGRGVAADPVAATKLYAAAAGKGNRMAMHNLASAFVAGSGVKKDNAEAARWFLRAANLGLTDSQFNLAVLYLQGTGVPKSLTEAYKWYAIAARGGDSEAKARMDALATQLPPDALKTAQAAADGFKPAAPDAGANVVPTEATLASRR